MNNKEKVVIVTKFYYRRGGDCIYAMNLERLLAARGHDVAVFAMDYNENDQSQWSAYWPAAVDFGGGMKAKFAAVRRTLGYGDVASAFKRLLDDFRPDVVHLNNIHSYLSPIVGGIAHKRGVRVVWTLHDYKLLCPAYSCLRQGRPCELCFADKKPVVKTRCMKGSLAASAVAYIEAMRWNRHRLERNTDCFICPSSFMKQKMEQGGFEAGKLMRLCNFMAPEMIEKYSKIDAVSESADYYCYVGRLSDEKGVRTLLATAAKLPYRLKIAGGGPLADELKSLYSQCENIEFLGHLKPEEILELNRNARFSVIPSECYENNPLSVIESFCAGTPVVGARIGGIPELVNQSRGLTFESGNGEDLAEAIRKAWTANFDRPAIRRRALEEFAPESYYQELMKIYRR